MIYHKQLLLITVGLLSSTFSCHAVIIAEEDQAYFEEFHTRLLNKYGADWDFEEQTYFYKIPSPPLPQQNNHIEDHPSESDILSVKFDNEPLYRESSTLFKTQDGALKIISDNLLPSVLLSDEEQEVKWEEVSSQKIPFISRANNLTSMIKAIREGYWIEEKLCTASLSPSEEFDVMGTLEVQLQHKKKHSLNVKAMAISYLKAQQQTGVFFDIYDGATAGEAREHFLEPLAPNKERTGLFSIHPRRAEQREEEKCFRVLNQQIYAYPIIKTTYEIFPDINARREWLPTQENAFYKLGQDDYCSLPLQYEKVSPVEEEEKLIENKNVLENKNDWTYYNKISEPQIISSDYLYCDGRGGFFTTYCYNEEWCDIEDGESKDISYLSPSIPVRLRGISFRGGYGDPKLGFYKQEHKDNLYETWRLESDEQDFSFTVDHRDFDSIFTTTHEPYSFQQTEQINTLLKWNPITSLSLKAVHITPPILDLLKEGANKITALDLSNITLNNISWSEVFRGLSHLTNLAELNLSGNHFGEEEHPFYGYVGIAYDPLPDLHEYLTRLNKLKILKIQGQNFEENSLFSLINETVKALTSIEEIHIDNIEFRKNWLRNFTKFARKNNHFQIRKLGRTLSQLQNLKSLKFYKNKGKDEVRDTLHNLGDIYYYGQKVSQNYIEASRWYKLAVTCGEHVDQRILVELYYALGDIYESGRGVERDYMEAAELYTQAAAQGHREAQYRLGLLYENGHGVELNYLRAAELYTQAAAQEYREAQYRLGLLYENGHGVELNYLRAAELYTQAAAQEYREAQYCLGLFYDRGVEGVPQNYATAIEWYQRALNNGYLTAREKLRDARYNLGRLHHIGDRGIPQNYGEAIRLYTLAANEDHRDAQYSLGDIYDRGVQGVPQDYATAIEWYQRALNNEHPTARKKLRDARYNLGRLHHIGDRGIPQNYGEAIRLYTLAANEDHRDAQCKLGDIYDRRVQGVPQNYATAIEWYQRAFNNKHPTAGEKLRDARYNLGRLHHTGDRGIPQSYEEAIRLYTLAANEDHRDAQYNLGDIYDRGVQGVPQNYEQAAAWWTLAANNGHAKAKYRLGYLYYHGRGVSQSYETAARLYTEATQKGKFNYYLYYLNYFFKI